MPLIRTLPEYEKIVNCKDPKEMDNLLVDVNQLTFDRFSDKVQLDTALADELTSNSKEYTNTLAEGEKKVSKAVCTLNAKFFTDKLIKLKAYNTLKILNGILESYPKVFFEKFYDDGLGGMCFGLVADIDSNGMNNFEAGALTVDGRGNEGVFRRCKPGGLTDNVKCSVLLHIGVLFQALRLRRTALSVLLHISLLAS